MDECLHKLYNTIKDGIKYLRENKDYSIEKYVVQNESDLPRCLYNYSEFFTENMKKQIINESSYIYFSSCVIFKRSFNIKIVFCDVNNNNIEQMFFMIYLWLYVISILCIDNSHRCTNTCNIVVFMVNNAKVLPEKESIIIGPEHVNSGYTHTCKENNEIVIYRQEEWFKVFVHETFHTFGIDFSMFTIDSYQSQLQSMFNVSTNIFLYEAYCETWARVINIIIYTTLMQKNQSFKTIKKTCIEYFQKETVHSMVQASKILKFMGLNYTILTSKHNDLQRISQMLYKESTNVLCYYIITALLMFYLDEFFSWCLTNNNDIICIPKKTKNVQLFVDFIKDHYLQEQFVELMNECITMEEELRDPSIQMTCFMTMTI
jgi:hypothetical protein